MKNFDKQATRIVKNFIRHCGEEGDAENVSAITRALDAAYARGYARGMEYEMSDEEYCEYEKMVARARDKAKPKGKGEGK